MKTKTCTCKKCTSPCHFNPGWFTPGEAWAAIKSGYADMMMRDYLMPCSKVGNESFIYVLAPASIGNERQDCPMGNFLDLISGDFHKGQCVFLKEERCMIHETGFKPRQCREFIGCENQSPTDNYEMAKLWDTDEGRMIIKLWKAELEE